MTQSAFRGDRMREARRRLDIRQEALAEQLGITRTQISNIERGASEPSMRVFALTAYLLNVSADWLLDLSDDYIRSRAVDEPIPFMEI